MLLCVECLKCAVQFHRNVTDDVFDVCRINGCLFCLLVCLIECVCRPTVGVVWVGLNPEDHQSFPIDMGRCCRHRCSSYYCSCCDRFWRGVGFPKNVLIVGVKFHVVLEEF